MLRRGDRRRPGAREHDLDLPDVLLQELEGVEQRGPGDDRRAVLVVVEDGDGEGVAQRLFDVEAVGGADVLQIDAADGRLEQLTEADHVIRLLRADLQVEHVDVGERLEQDSLALHHRLPGEWADVPEAEHRGSVRDHRHEIAFGGVAVDLIGALGDLAAGLRHAGRIGERQVALVLEGLGGRDLDLPRATLRVVVEGLLATARHRGHKSFFVKELCYRPAPELSRRRTGPIAQLTSLHAPTLSRTCTLRGRPTDAPLKNAPLSR